MPVQVGSYSPSQRVACFFYKAVLFFTSAFGASVVGHSLAKAAVSSFLQTYGQHVTPTHIDWSLSLPDFRFDAQPACGHW